MTTDPREIREHLAGVKQSHRNRETGTTVTVYDGAEQGMDTSGGRWQTVCEQHGAICSHDTLEMARWHAAAPSEWCDGCRETATNRGGGNLAASGDTEKGTGP